MKVLLTWPADEQERARIRAALPEAAMLSIPTHRPYLTRYEATPVDLLREAHDTEVLMGWVAPRQVIEAAPKLRLLLWLHGGCDGLNFELLRERGIAVANVAGAHSVYIAEQAMMLVLGLAKNVLAGHRFCIEGHRKPWWDPAHVSVPLLGRTIAIIGLGAIGKAVAERAKSFGMRVIGTKRRPEVEALQADEIHGPNRLNEVLGRADFVVLTVPLTAETHHLIGEPELRAMKPGAFLVNVSRGQVVAEAPLYRALTEGWIAGFATDVWWDYNDEDMPPGTHFPTLSRSGVQRLPNILGSPDYGGNLLEVKDAMIERGIENLVAFIKGESLPNRVDLEAGY